MKSIVLIGMAGCGKTTIGREAAKALGVPFLDVDELIEQNFGPIPKLFEKGEAFFREREAEAVQETCGETGAVIATGGGVVTQPASMEALKQTGTVIFIDRPIEKIVADINLSTRPLFICGIEALYKTWQTRLPLYRKYADHTVENSGSVEDTCEKIVRIAKETGE